MEIGYIIFLIALIRGVASAFGNRRPAITTIANSVPESLCVTCAYAHIACGYRERDKLIACTFGGSPRPLKFAVSNCTLYCSRNSGTQLVRVAGFAECIDTSVAPAVAAKIAH
jgi:hypothetical protein